MGQVFSIADRHAVEHRICHLQIHLWAKYMPSRPGRSDAHESAGYSPNRKTQPLSHAASRHEVCDFARTFQFGTHAANLAFSWLAVETTPCVGWQQLLFNVFLPVTWRA
jgi:hypothetical protein